MALYPTTTADRVQSRLIKFLDDSEQRWTSAPMMSAFMLQYVGVSGFDLAQIRTFFLTCKGRCVDAALATSFSFTLGPRLYQYCVFDQDGLDVQSNPGEVYSFTLRIKQVRQNDYYVAGTPATIFPQLRANGMMTQYPYVGGQAFDTILQDMPSGMRWARNRRLSPLASFILNYPSISDDDVETLRAFFYNQQGQTAGFCFLDPGGNLVQSSEDFTVASWTRSGLSSTGDLNGPFGSGSVGSVLSSTGYGSSATTIVGPAAGGLDGYAVSASIYLKRQYARIDDVPDFDSITDFDSLSPYSSSVPIPIRVGFLNAADGTEQYVEVVPPPSWVRIDFSSVIWFTGPVTLKIAAQAAGDVGAFGAQVVPMKGPGAYIRTPGNYGLHPKVRFATDTFACAHNSPNDNAAALPLVEYK
jgi:hypothetical protein